MDSERGRARYIAFNFDEFGLGFFRLVHFGLGLVIMQLLYLSNHV